MNNEINVSSHEVGQNQQEQVTVFQDPVQEAMYEKPMIAQPSDWIKIADDDTTSDIKKFLARPIPFKIGEFSSSDVDDVELGTFPNIILSTSSALRSKLVFYEYFRANVHVKVVFNAMPFQSGKYWLYFSPYDTESNRGARGDLANATGYPGIEIDIASGTPVEIVIPYCAPLSHYNLVTAESTMGTLRMIPIAAAASSETPTTISYTMYGWFTEVDLTLPTYKNLNSNFVAQVLVNETVAPILDPVVDGVKAAASNALQTVTQLPLTWMSRALSGVASTLGFSKPINNEPCHSFSNLPGKGYTNYDGHDSSVVLGATTDNAIQSYPGIFSTDADEMDIDFVKKKSCIFRSVLDWNVSSPVGTELATIPVTPGYCAAPVDGEAKCTTLAYLASMFRYWRGGMKYRFSFAKTGFHSGRIRFTFVPRVAGSQTPFAPGDQVYQAHNWVLDLSQSSEISFVVPYVSNKPWLPVEVIPADATDIFREASTGYIIVEVLTQLRKGGQASDIVKIACWSSGADDLEFSIPDFASYYPFFTPPPPPNPLTRIEEVKEEESEFEAQVFEELSKDANHVDQVNPDQELMFSAPAPPPLVPQGLSIGEKISSLRQLIKRFGPMWVGLPAPYRRTDNAGYSLMGPFAANNTSEQYSLNSIQLDPAYFGGKSVDPLTYVRNDMPVALGANPLIPPTLGECDIGRLLPPTAPLHYISYLYRFYRGGRRYKIWTLPSRTPRVTSGRFAPPNDDANPTTFLEPTNSMTTVEYVNERSQLPYVVTRNRDLLQNGDVAPPALVAGYKGTQQPVFETFQYPDLNGCVEVEVPYYSSLPISVVGEGTLASAQGPMVERSTVNFTLGSVLDDLEQPFPIVLDNPANVYNPNICTRASIGSCRVYTAASDDFSFGYLVGAPSIRRAVT